MLKTLIATIIVLLSANTHAADASKCKIEYMATLNGGAALKPTVLTIRNDGEIVLALKASSAVIKTLDCGKQYVASVTTEIRPDVKVTRTRTIMLISSFKLIMAMDK